MHFKPAEHVSYTGYQSYFLNSIQLDVKVSVLDSPHIVNRVLNVDLGCNGAGLRVTIFYRGDYEFWARMTDPWSNVSVMHLNSTIYPM